MHVTDKKVRKKPSKTKPEGAMVQNLEQKLRYTPWLENENDPKNETTQDEIAVNVHRNETDCTDYR